MTVSTKQVVLAIVTLGISGFNAAIAQDEFLIKFEAKGLAATTDTSHKAKVTAVEELSKQGKRFAAKTLVDADAGADKFFRTGFQIPVTDLSAAGTLSFWIKTDIEGGFNLQLHSELKGISVIPFSTAGSKDAWKKIEAQLTSLKVPSWSKAKVDLKRINRVQFTAFGAGPYDGKYIMIRDVQSDVPVLRSESGMTVEIRNARAARLREPVVVERGEQVDMFDGKTLAGWNAIPRVYVPRGEEFAQTPPDQLFDAVIKYYENSDGQLNRIPDRERVKNKGVWKVEDGVVIGAQTPGSIAGSYLMSVKKYGDFELTLEANPDYPLDTGIMIRAHELGSVGFQVLVDHRPNGTIGGVYGNSVGDFFAYPFVFDADEEPLNRVANFRPGNPNAMKFRGGQFQTDYAASLEDFLKEWKPNDWNEIKIRCTGRMPLIETWINGVAIAKIDTATLADIVPNYNSDAIFNRIGRKGHIGLEVHDSPTRDRWAPGAECRWRNVRIRELVCAETNKTAAKHISLARIKGRHWLVDADGKPFFAHGITHVNNNRAKIDYQKISEACKALGFNAYGYGTPDQLMHDMPFIASWNHLVPISYYRGNRNVEFIDIFDPKEQARLDFGVRNNCRQSLKHSRNVIGFCWTDLGAWPLENPAGKNWVEFIRGLPEGAPGQKVYQAFLNDWKGDDDKARDQAFLRLIAREYFRVLGEANRRYAPGKLIFGDRFAFNTADPDVLEEMLPWVDAIAIQPHFRSNFPTQEFNKIYELTGKPILICDYAIRFKDGDKDIRNWKLAEDSVAAGKAYTEYVKAALDTEYILGVFWCNPVDTAKGFGNPGVKQGFFGEGLTERPGLHRSVKELNIYREKVTPTGGVK